MAYDASDIEHFRQELSATVRAISGNEHAEVNFPLISFDSLSDSYLAKHLNQIFIAVPKNPTKRHLKWARGEADALALMLRHHDDIVSEEEHAYGEDVKTFIQRLEQVRVEAIGALQMEGVAKNLEQRWHQRLKEKSYDKRENIANVPAEEVAALLAYQAITGKKLPKSAQLIRDSLGAVMVRKIASEIKELSFALKDQEKYAKIVEKMVRKLIDQEPQSQNLQEQEAKTSSGEDQQDEKNSSENTKAALSKATSLPQKGDYSKESMTKAQLNPDEARDERDDAMEYESQKPEYETPKESVAVVPYRVYTREYDQIAYANDLAGADELWRYRQRLEQELEKIHDITNKLAGKLQRHLMAKQECSWDFNMEEGLLDNRKFPQIIIDPTYPTPYKWERRSEFKDTVLTLLLDNSGSMRGRPITIASICADILARTMERCGVKVEILGFTTKHWKGGQSYKKWEKDGSPAFPGRLNDLLHVVYKEADMPWRASKQNLGLMLKEGLLKENIDGEALLWAHGRLIRRQEDRKILMVISDGAPVDDSTLSTNPSNYLDVHLKEVVKDIEGENKIDLLAIGIGHNVATHYSRSVMIRQVDELADAMVNQLVMLFDDIIKANERHRRPKSL